jgi:hypothetical protein
MIVQLSYEYLHRATAEGVRGSGRLRSGFDRSSFVSQKLQADAFLFQVKLITVTICLLIPLLLEQRSLLWLTRKEIEPSPTRRAQCAKMGATANSVGTKARRAFYDHTPCALTTLSSSSPINAPIAGAEAFLMAYT